MGIFLSFIKYLDVLNKNGGRDIVDVITTKLQRNPFKLDKRTAI